MGRVQKTRREQNLEFAVLLAFVLGLLGAAWHFGFQFWFIEFRQRPELARWLWLVSPAVALVALALPRIWDKAYAAWMKLAEAMAWVVTRVVLSLCYFLAVTPIGLLMRVLGKRPLDLRFRDGKTSYWIEKQPGEFTLERYEKQF